MKNSLINHLTHPARKHIASGLIALLTLSSSNALLSAPLQEVESFEALGQVMRDRRVPLLLVFEVEHCNFCLRLKAEQLQPINNNDDYQKRIIIRTIKMDSEAEISGFGGEKTSPANLSKHYNAYLTPTLLFLNDKGEEIAERMLGYNSPDYYGLYLDQAIATAEKALQPSEDERSCEEL